MRKIQCAICAVAMSVSAGSYAAGSSGTVTFNGKLEADTCQIVDNLENITVPLPHLSVQSFPKAGVELGTKFFEIKVTKCPSTITGVAAHFEANINSGVNTSTYNLTNSATTNAATNIEVRLYNDDHTQLRVGDTGKKYFTVTPGTGTNPLGDATLTYAGGYYSTGVPTVGDVTAQVTYVLAYP